MSKNKEEGKQAARTYYNSQGFAGYSRNIRAEDAMRIFLPPIKESMSQMITPMPKDRAAWMAGFKEEQIKILAEVEDEQTN